MIVLSATAPVGPALIPEDMSCQLLAAAQRMPGAGSQVAHNEAQAPSVRRVHRWLLRQLRGRGWQRTRVLRARCSAGLGEAELGQACDLAFTRAVNALCCEGVLSRDGGGTQEAIQVGASRPRVVHRRRARHN